MFNQNMLVEKQQHVNTMAQARKATPVRPQTRYQAFAYAAGRMTRKPVRPQSRYQAYAYAGRRIGGNGRATSAARPA